MPIDNLSRKVDHFSHTVEDMNHKLDILNKQNRTNRFVIWGMAVGLVLTVFLSLGLGLALHNTNDAQAKANHAIVVNCQTSNETAAKEHQLWQGVIVLTNNPVQPTDPAIIKQFNTLLDQTFSQRQC
jgi:hypothetical protein